MSNIFHDQKLLASFLNEMKIMQTIDHPRILKLHDKIKEGNVVYLITSYCNGGNLEEFME